MLFISPEFLFGFLPVVIALVYLQGALLPSNLLRVGILTFASLFFYGWWNPSYLIIILASIVVNLSIGWALSSDNCKSLKGCRLFLLIAAIILNLSVLVFYKYSAFLIENLNTFFQTDYEAKSRSLPLGISFFTFQQIVFIVEVYKGKIEKIDLARYPIFVTFFPQLIAGPIVHYGEMVPQFTSSRERPELEKMVSIGVLVFVAGLFKKIVLADNLAEYADPVFQYAEEGQAFGTWAALIGMFAYSLQLYFDFSGYSDMAVGLGLLFGIRLPFNFDSPYKASSFIDFWKRWHITLSRFLRDFLYIPLGGNRKGIPRRYANLMVTMLIGGLWHGAGWNFVLWGGIHGLLLSFNHLFRSVFQTKDNPGLGRLSIVKCLLTFLVVSVLWIFFRAETLTGAMHFYQALFFNTVPFNEGIFDLLKTFSNQTQIWTLHDMGFLNSLQIQSYIGIKATIFVFMSLLLCLLLPSVKSLATRLETNELSNRAMLKYYALAGFMCAIVCLSSFNTEESPFLYFQF